MKDYAHLIFGYALVFGIGWFLPMADHVPYALGVAATTLVVVVDYAFARQENT